MATSKAAYVEMIRLLKLSKARHEMALGQLGAQAKAIEEENLALLAMNDGRFEGAASFVPANIIMRRLETNKTRLAIINDGMVAQRHELLRASRTVDILKRRLVALENELERIRASTEMDEHIGYRLAHDSGSGSSLP